MKIGSNYIIKIIQYVFRKLGYSISKIESQSDQIADLQKKIIGEKENVVIFDVGAYEGETVLDYFALFGKKSKIYAFEPFPKKFKKLEGATTAYQNIKVYNFALGNKTDTVDFYVNNFHATNSLLKSDPKSQEEWGKGLMETQKVIKVKMNTIDRFVEEKKIDQIDILKLDTQGSEHLVLEGARNSIKNGKIKLICAEIIVVPTYEGQKHYLDIIKMYHQLGFSLFNLFKYTNSEGKIRFFDGIFVYNN